MTIIRSAVAGLIALMLTGASGSADASSLGRFKGKTLAQFMLETMITPYDFFETEGKRVFLADKRAPDPAFGCSLQLVAVANGKGPNADGWTIVEIRSMGGCDFI